MSILHSFNSKVNLSELLRESKLTDFKIVKIQPYGEFAYSPDLTKVYTFVELSRIINGSETMLPSECYNWLSVYRSEWLCEIEFPLNSTKKALDKDYEDYLTWKLFVERAKYNFINSKPYKTDISMWGIYQEEGLLGGIENQFGYLDKALIEIMSASYKMSNVSKYKNPIVLPYYYAPGYVSKIEIFEVKNIENREILWQKDDGAGWAGDPSRVLSNIKELETSKGSIWHETQSYWTQGECTISEFCDTKLCLELFKSISRVKFDIHPLDLIIEQGNENRIFEHLRVLNIAEADRASNYLKIPAISQRRKAIAKSEHLDGNILFWKNQNGYFMRRKGEESHLTNFSTNRKSAQITNGEMTYTLEVLQGNKSITIDIKQRDIYNIRQLKSKLAVEFHKANLEHPQFKQSIVDIKLSKLILDFFEE